MSLPFEHVTHRLTDGRESGPFSSISEETFFPLSEGDFCLLILAAGNAFILPRILHRFSLLPGQDNHEALLSQLHLLRRLYLDAPKFAEAISSECILQGVTKASQLQHLVQLHYHRRQQQQQISRDDGALCLTFDNVKDMQKGWYRNFGISLQVRWLALLQSHDRRSGKKGDNIILPPRQGQRQKKNDKGEEEMEIGSEGSDYSISTSRLFANSDPDNAVGSDTIRGHSSPPVLSSSQALRSSTSSYLPSPPHSSLRPTSAMDRNRPRPRLADPKIEQTCTPTQQTA